MDEVRNKGVLIFVDGTRVTLDWTRESLYQLLIDQLGGYIEVVALNKHGMNMYVNEDGIRLGLEPNALATTLYMEEFFPVPPILGNAFIVGLPDKDGNDTTLQPDQINALHEHETKVSFAFISEADLNGHETEDGDLDNTPPNIKDESQLEAFLRMEREDNLTSLTEDPIAGEDYND